MPNLAMTPPCHVGSYGFRPADELAPRLCFHPADGGRAGSRPADRERGNGAGCFRPADDSGGEAGFCFRPADATAPNTASKGFYASDDGSVSPCFRPDDDQPAAVAADPGRPVSPCHHPADPDVNACFHPGANANGCFHPEEPDVNACFYPGAQPPVNSCRHASDDLATDLHLALTGIEERHLAALTGRP